MARPQVSRSRSVQVAASGLPIDLTGELQAWCSPLNYTAKTPINTPAPCLQARRPSLRASLTIRQALAGVLCLRVVPVGPHLRLTHTCALASCCRVSAGPSPRPWQRQEQKSPWVSGWVQQFGCAEDECCCQLGGLDRSTQRASQPGLWQLCCCRAAAWLVRQWWQQSPAAAVAGFLAAAPPAGAEQGSHRPHSSTPACTKVHVLCLCARRCTPSTHLPPPSSLCPPLSSNNRNTHNHNTAFFLPQQPPQPSPQPPPQPQLHTRSRP